MLTALAIFGLFAPMALLGIPYRIGQAITGTLRARLKATHGWRQISGGSGVTLFLVNLHMLIYTLGFFLYFFLSPPSESVGPTLFLLLGLCGVGYAVMEVLLIPLPPLPSPRSLQHI